MTMTQQIGIKSILGGSILTALLFGGMYAQAASPAWDTTGGYVVAFEYQGVDYTHDVAITQNATGVLSGSGGSPVGAHVYTWIINTGSVSDSVIDFSAQYTATADAVTPLTTMHVIGTIASTGAMSGTWSDNYQGGERAGTWKTISGAALVLNGTLVAEDFGVVTYNTGLGVIKGYTAGFGLIDATFAGAQSVVVQLYSSTTLLQTNTAILPQFNLDIVGTQFSSPFDVSGTFNYAADGYWMNVRAVQYGQSVPATRVVATVTLASGKVITAENNLLTGDPATIYPVIVPPVVVSPTTKLQCMNNGWKTFSNPTYKNQGMCVSYVAHLTNSQRKN